MAQPGEQAQLHRAPSVGTNASGIAQSIVDAESLANFPPPPDEIPLTPLREYVSSPSRIVFGGTPPVTPSRKHFRISSPSSGMPMPRRQGSAGSVKSHQTSTSNASSGSRRTVAQNDYRSIPPVPPLNPIRRNGGGIDRPPPLPVQDEWHEGSSKIIVGRAEERMLSTSFITDLLSSTEDITSHEYPHASGSKSYPPSYVTNDGMSTISEIYPPPPPSGLAQTPPANIERFDFSSSSRPHNPRHSQGSQPPESFLTLDSDGRSVAGSNVTFDGNEPYGGSVIRTASTTRKLGTRGASVVGYAPATLRRVSLTPSGPSSNMTNSSHIGAVYESMALMPGPGNEVDAQRLTMPDFHAGPSPMLYSPAQRSSMGLRNSDLQDGARTHSKSRQSMQSTKTTKSFLSSFIPRFSTSQSTGPRGSKSMTEAVTNWFKLKPLPRLPVHPDMSIAAEAEHRKDDDALPLPELVNRAGALQGMLEKGHHPHNSFHHNRLNSTSTASKGGYYTDRDVPFMSAHWERGLRDGRSGSGAAANIPGFFSRARRGDNGAQGQWVISPDSPKIRGMPMTKKKRIIGSIVVLLLALALGIGLGVGLAKKHKLPNCPGHFTGNACNLDATCVCTSSLPGQCNALAQALIDLVPTINTFFNANYTPNSLANAVWEVQGAPPSNQCASQALLVDVAPALDSSMVPNRTQWTQSAMLWNLAQSQDMSALTDMHEFVSKAPWSSLGEKDGPIADTSSKFSVSESGFLFDFAMQTVTQPSVSFVSNGAPTSAQIAQVGSTASSALDRMYSFALASSNQRQQAIANYWRTTLGQKPEDYERFLSAISTSPILLPFDATASPATHAVSGLLTNSSSSPFPVPLACYPGLTSTQLNLLNSIETAVFDLPPASATSEFNTSCFADRPIYGVLDILQLRLPFVDSRTGVAKQAAVLTHDAAPRAVVYSGEVLSALPGTPQAQNTTQSQQVDPRQYGTLNHLNHLMLNFLSSIPDVNVAIALVSFILTSPTVPPSNTTDLYKSLSSIPTLEVAVFGTINPSDVSHAVSSFSTPSGSLFFGSDQSLALRNWAINGAGSSVVWTETTGSPEVVRDTSLSDLTFNSVWDPAYTYLHSTQQGVTVNVGNITAAFRATGMFSP